MLVSGEPFRVLSRALKALMGLWIPFFCVVVLFTFKTLFFTGGSKLVPSEQVSDNVIVPSNSGNTGEENPFSEGDYQVLSSLAPLQEDSLTQLAHEKLEKGFLFHGANSRFDAPFSSVCVSLAVPKIDSGGVSGEPSFFPVGKKVYIDFFVDGEGRTGLRFSKEKTPFCVEFYPKEQGSTLEVRAEVASPLPPSTFSFLLRKTPFSVEGKEAELMGEKEGEWKTALRLLKQAELYPPDAFLSLYGGDLFQEKAQRWRLRPPGGEMVPCEEGDIWRFKGGKWERSFSQQGDLGEEMDQKGYPIFRIVSTPDVHEEGSLAEKRVERGKYIRERKSLQVECWDQSGLIHETVTLFEKPLSRSISFHPKEVFQKVRRRSASSVSCYLKGRHTVMREGDWVLRSIDGKWRFLRTLEEWKGYIEGTIQGDLFVFDGLEKEGSSHFFVGHFFDSMRNRVESVRFPLVEKREKIQKGKTSSDHPGTIKQETMEQKSIKESFSQETSQENRAEVGMSYEELDVTEWMRDWEELDSPHSGISIAEFTRELAHGVMRGLHNTSHSQQDIETVHHD